MDRSAEVSDFVCIIPGPQEVVRVEPAGERWCFGQRKRLPHEWRMMNYDKGSPFWGWYDPLWLCICSGCGKDRTRFGDGR